MPLVLPMKFMNLYFDLLDLVGTVCASRATQNNSWDTNWFINNKVLLNTDKNLMFIEKDTYCDTIS